MRPAHALAAVDANRGVSDEAAVSHRRRQPGDTWKVLFVFAAVAAVVWLVVGLSAAHLPWDARRDKLFDGWRWLEGWVHFDSGWYYEIAERGYHYEPGRQGPVAFFPAYPLVMRAGAWLLGSSLVAGILATLASGVAVALLFWEWLRQRAVARPAAWTALLLLLVYPYSYYLFGAVYADALFVAALLGSFVLLEHDRPVLAGLVGAVATAARPVGIVIVVALAVRALERRGALTAEWRGRHWRLPRISVDRRAVRLVDAGVLLSALGLLLFCAYLWHRFGDPLAWGTIQEAWDQEPGVRTWLKFQFFSDVRDFSSPIAWSAFVAHFLLTALALLLVPAVLRRFGLGYGVLSLLLILVPAFSSKNFFGMSRYLLAAFPCFAVGGELLASRPRLRVAVLAASSAILLVASYAYATAHYLT